VDGLRLLPFLGAYFCLALVCAAFGAWFCHLSSLAHFRPDYFSFLPFLLVVFMPIFPICLMQYQRRQSLRDLCRFRELGHYLRHLWWPMIWPALGFVGLLRACGLLYGISWFVGLGVVFASFHELLRHYGDRIDDPHPRSGL
jgi:ABC-type polysaccharide/polyol phosphate export permease